MKQSWDHIDSNTREAFVDFLERSCTSEFSGFILFKELSRQLKERNPILAEIFHLMARDEARHAGFINKAMSDFNISLDLGYLTKHRVYTFFKPEWVIYAVYLSEKIGYWRYILMYRHLERNPHYQFYPIFKSLSIGARMKAVMVIFLKLCYDRSLLCGRGGKPNYGRVFSPICLCYPYLNRP